MINELSILIPVYNGVCTELVKSLRKQAERYAETCGSFRYEIIAADDGSTDKGLIEQNGVINGLEKCSYIVRGENCGRAAIRNFLAQKAKYGWLLFIDCDMVVGRSDYITKYIREDSGAPVVYGGYVITGDRKRLRHNLRYMYEKRCERRHLTEERRKNPYKDFHTSNFMVRRDIMLANPFDMRFVHYGYEDVLWGKTLCENNIDIQHIDNPLNFCKYETNGMFVAKTEEGLRTLRLFSDDLKGYSGIISCAGRLEKMSLIKPAARLSAIFGKHIRRCLTCNKPKLFLFNIYKLGFYITLGEHDTKP